MPSRHREAPLQHLNHSLDGGQVALIAVAACFAALCAIVTAICTRRRLQQRFDDELTKLKDEMEEARERKARSIAAQQNARDASMEGARPSCDAQPVPTALRDDVARVFHVAARCATTTPAEKAHAATGLVQHR